jgi:hypothetical protein
MDRNYSQILIIWDKIFGTFQEELPDVPPVYGITRPVQTWNPIKINFQHLGLLISDAWRTRNWTDKLRIWFMPTGWRPADIAELYPVRKIQDVYHFAKYNPEASRQLKTWTWIQFVWTILLIFYFFGNIARIGSPNVFYYGGFIFLTIYAFTELMDRNPTALVWEIAKNAIGIAIILYLGDWFGSNALLPGVQFAMIAYFAIASIVTAWIVKSDINPNIEKTKDHTWGISA